MNAERRITGFEHSVIADLIRNDGVFLIHNVIGIPL